MTVIKRDKQASTTDLIKAIDALVPLLRDQNEDEAVESLLSAAETLKTAPAGSPKHRDAIAKVIDAFEDGHELMAYTFQRPNSTEWTEVEELSQASSRVISLARRIKV